MAETTRPKSAGDKPGGAPSAWSANLAAVWKGFSEPSALSFLSFLVSLTLTLGLCLWFFSPATLGGPMGRFIPRSAYGFATLAALRTGHRPPDQPRLILLGTSTIAQAMGTGRLLDERIEAGTGQAWEVVNLATPLQSPTDQFALLETALASQTDESPMAVVAIGFGVARLRWTTDQVQSYFELPRLGLTSAWADDEARLLGLTVPSRTGFYILDNRSFVLENGAEALLRLALQRPAKQKGYVFTGGVPQDREARRDRIGAETRNGVVRQDAYLDQIARLMDRVATVPNTTVVLIEETLSPLIVAEEDLAGPRAALEAALQQRRPAGLPEFWPIATEAGLTAADFGDELHIRPGAPQERMQTALADHIITAQQGLGGGGNGN